MPGDRWAMLGAAAGKALVDVVRPHERQIDRAWDLFKQYAPKDALETVDRAVALVTLGFPPTSTPTDDEVGAAFKAIAVECHPDKTTDPAAHVRYVAATAARDVLTRRY